MSIRSVLASVVLVGVCGFVTSPPAAAQDDTCWLRDASAPTPNTVFTLCQQGAVWVTIDGGANWSAVKTGAKSRLRAIAFTSADHGVVVGDNGQILVTEDRGKTWKSQDSGTTDTLMDVAFVGQTGWAAGYQGIVLHTVDAGRTWTKETSGTTQAIESLYFLDANTGWAVGWAGTILRTTDGGTTWKASKTSDSSWSLSSVFFRDAKEGWCSGFAGQILHSRDGGATWESVKSPVRNWLTSVVADSRGALWMSYDDGLLTSQDGLTWRAVPVGGAFFLSRLFRVNQSVWALGQSTVLRQNGNTWQRVESLVPDANAKLLRAAGSVVDTAGDPAPDTPAQP